MDDIVREVQRMYDSAGEYFSKTRQKSYGQSPNWPVVQRYLDRLAPGQAVLDVGCGDGRLVSGLPAGVEYVGIDFSTTLLAIARQRYPEREWRLGNIAEDEVWKGLAKVEAVFCVATLHHLPSRAGQLKALRKMHQVTKRGGRLYLTVWNLWQARMIERGLTEGVIQAGEVVQLEFDRRPGRYVVAMDLAYLVKLVTEAGWEVVEVFYANREGKKVGLTEGQNLVLVATRS